MLVDVQFRQPGGQMGLILSAIADGRTGVTRAGRGMYLLNHWSFDMMLGDACVDKYPCDAFEHIDHSTEPDEWKRQHDEWTAAHPGLPGSYGVCDRPEQLAEKYPALHTDPRPLVAAFVHLTKADQPERGGWRWHKWGGYIGDQEPLCEYLADEPHIDEVYTFSVYEVAPWAVIEPTEGDTP